VSLPPLLAHQRLARLAIAGAFLLGAGIVLVEPAVLSFPKPACGFRSLTGLPCAFCGGTRAAAALAAGDAAGALRMNALVFPLALGVVAVTCLSLFEAWRARPVLDWGALAKRGKVLAPWLVVLLILWWMPHVVMALRDTGSGLANPGHPLVRLLGGG
jgi:hypothetical protein